MDTRPSGSRALYRRIRSVVSRRRLDGRLAEPTADLLAATWQYRLSAGVALLKSPRLSPSAAPLRLAVAQSGRGRARRWWTSGPLDRSVQDLSHDLAREVTEQLQRHELAPFIIDVDHGLHFGLDAADRATALSALRGLDDASEWYLQWRRGHRWRCRRLTAYRARRARNAEIWHLFRCLSIGTGYVAGPAQAVRISFWTLTDSERYERLAKRGLHRFEAVAEPANENVDGHDYPSLTAFSVSRSLDRIAFPIDMVITWVDGSEETWRSAFQHWSDLERPGDRNDHAVHEARYTSHDELRYVLRSIWMNAGWVRRIHVVTADQQPDWLQTDERLRLVSHRDILPPEALPTFNSHAIESRLHHIDDLAEHFIYFNDDMFLGRPVLPGQFFTSSGLSRFFDSDARIPLNTGGPSLAADTGARRGRGLIEADFSLTVTHKLHHAPYALRRSVLDDIEERYQEVVSATTASRFRHPDDLSIPSAFAHHYAYLTGRAVPGDLKVGYENLGSAKLKLFLDRVRLGAEFDVICVNETERWERSQDSAEAMFSEFLEHYFAVASPWEMATPR